MNDMIERVIREEVQKILSVGSEVPQDDMPQQEQEVPLNDLPGTVLEDNGLSRDDMRIGGADESITLTQYLQGQQVEPNEALESSALDPLENVAIGSAVQGALKLPSAYANRVTRNSRLNRMQDKFRASKATGEPVSSFAKPKSSRNVLDPEAGINNTSSTLYGSTAKEMARNIPGPVGQLFNKAGDIINSVSDPLLAPVSTGSARRLINSNEPKIQAMRRGGRKVDKLFGSDIDTPIRRYATGSAVNDLMNGGDNIKTIGANGIADVAKVVGLPAEVLVEAASLGSKGVEYLQNLDLSKYNKDTSNKSQALTREQAQKIVDAIQKQNNSKSASQSNDNK